MSKDREISFRNSENEKISIAYSDNGEFAGQPILIIHDDEDRFGRSAEAPMLLDEPTINWLERQFTHIRAIAKDK